MVEEKKKEDSNEILAKIIGEPTVQGFRKGVTKKSILKDLSDEEWVHIDGVKAAGERKTNPLAYKIFVKNDQMYQQFQTLKRNLSNLIIGALQLKFLKSKNEVDIAAGRTDQKGDDGNILSLEELRMVNAKVDINIQQTMSLVVSDLSKLYTYVGSKGLDNKPFFDEGQYDAIAKDAVRQFKEIGYDILE